MSLRLRPIEAVCVCVDEVFNLGQQPDLLTQFETVPEKTPKTLLKVVNLYGCVTNDRS